MGQVILMVLLTVTVLTGCAAFAVAPGRVRARPPQRRASRRAIAPRAPGPNASTLMDL
jgi:hypothetical protein